MDYFRRIAAIIAALLGAATAASVAAASRAFAAIVAPPGGGPFGFASPHTHEGTSNWELAFIALAIVVFVSLSAILLRVQIRVKRPPVAA